MLTVQPFSVSSLNDIFRSLHHMSNAAKKHMTHVFTTDHTSYYKLRYRLKTHTDTTHYLVIVNMADMNIYVAHTVAFKIIQPP